MNNHNNAGHGRTRERVESLLRAAADFEPAESAPIGLAARALAQRPAGRSYNRAALMFGVGVAVILLALPTIWLMHRPASRPTAPQIAIVPKTLPAHSDVPPADRRKEEIYLETNRQFVRQTIFPSEPDGQEYVRPKRHHRRRYRIAKAPRVRWHDEMVAEYQSGVLTPAWIVRRDDENDTVVATPVMVDTPLQSGEIPIAQSTPDNRQVAFINYTEETQESP